MFIDEEGNSIVKRSDKNKIWLLTALTIACQNKVIADDWIISSPVIIESGYESTQLLVNSNINAINGNEATIKINGSLDGIVIFPDRSIQTNEGFRRGALFTPNTAAISITESGRITGTIDNRGYIRSGINIEGEAVMQSGSALNVQGREQEKKAVILESVTLHNSGYMQAENDHVITIGQHGFIDFISIETGSFIHSEGLGKNALYIAENGQLGGSLSQSVSVDDSVYYSGNDATPIMNIQGRVSSARGSGIKINGAAHGAIILSGGQLSGSDGEEEAGIRVNGNYYGTIKNYAGTIDNGVVIAGNHVGATQSASTPIASIDAGDQSVYISAGEAAKYAELRGGYSVLDGGVTQAHNNHAIYLNDYSTADFISVAGMLSTSSNQKSAIYVADNSILGLDSNQAAIQVHTGGLLTSLQGAAIDVDGYLNGWVFINGGTLSTGSTDSDHNYAIDFSDANSNLQFFQAGETALTQGKIAGSALDNDYIEINAGSIQSDSISGVEYIKMSSGSIDSRVISGIKHMQVLGGAVTSDSILGSDQSSMEVSNARVTSNVLSGLKHLQIDTDSHVHITGNFTAPELTTIKLSDGYSQDNALISVDQRLSAYANGSQFIIQPKSTAAFHDMIEKKYVTVLEYNAAVTASLSDSFSPTASEEFIREDSVLFDLTQEFSDNGRYIIHIHPKSTKDIIENVEVTDQEKELLTNAILAATVENSDNPDKQSVMLDSLREGTIQELVDDMEPVNPANLEGLNAIQQIVHQRLQLVTGLGFGDNYFDYDGDAFYEDIYDAHYGRTSNSGFSFLGGAGWGQLIYGNSSYDGVEGGSGFSGNMSGFILGADTELTNTFRIGAAGSWTHNKLAGENSSSVTINSYMATFYSHWYTDGWYTDAILSAGRGQSNASQILLDKPIVGQYNSTTMGFRLVTGHKFSLGAVDISPQTEFHYGNMSFDAYEEEGNTGFEKRININDYQIMELGFGFRLSLPTEKGYNIRPEISMMGYYDFKNTGTEIEATYLAGGDAFTTVGPSRDQFRLQSGMALSIDIMENWMIDATYNLNWSKSFLSNNFSAKARYEF